MWFAAHDGDHAAIGTTFEPSTRKENSQPLELWLAQQVQPAIAFQFEVVDYHGTRLILLCIPAATNAPVEFERTAYIRIGSATPRLPDHSERLRALWTIDEALNIAQSKRWMSAAQAGAVGVIDAMRDQARHSTPPSTRPAGPVRRWQEQLARGDGWARSVQKAHAAVGVRSWVATW